MSQAPCSVHSIDSKTLPIATPVVSSQSSLEDGVWRSIVFSVESRFCLGASDGRVLVTRKLGERLKPNCLRPRHAGPTPGVMVWGAISYDSRSTHVVIPNTSTVNLYVSLIIQPVILPFINRIQGGVFQQNNARPHTALVT